MPRKLCLCGVRPSFNFPGITPGICCDKCKTEGMVNVISKKCPCGTKPHYNYPGITPSVCCAVCKTDGMVIVGVKLCLCGKQPRFNFPEETRGVCCDKCKTGGMVNVMSKKCPCGVRPHYNFPGITPGVCCRDCKTDGMVIVDVKLCPCGKQMKYNFPDKTWGECCRFCKTDGMIDVVGKICPGYNGKCPVRTRVSRGNIYCMSCDPNEARRKRFKLYENAFFDYVNGKLDVYKREYHIDFDPTETSFKFARLDGIVFGDGVIVCLEVDEDGHKNNLCDEHRMDLVSAELLIKSPGYNIAWVRVNPTIDTKNQWSDTSKKIREIRFQEVVDTVNDILETKECGIKYIGF